MLVRMSTERTYLTRQEAAQRAGVSIGTLDRWIRSGYLRKYVRQHGRHVVRVDEAQLERLLEIKEKAA